MGDMGDMGDYYRDVHEHYRERKEREGIDCPGCPKVQPKRIPTRLLPGQRCKVCGFVAPHIKSNNAGQNRPDERQT